MDSKAILMDLANRFKEPSSWAGIGALLTLTGLHMSATEVNYIVDIGIGVSGLLAFFISEKKS